MFGDFDIIVVGAGHAGCEAAYVSATLGSKDAKTTLVEILQLNEEYTLHITFAETPSVVQFPTTGNTLTYQLPNNFKPNGSLVDKPVTLSYTEASVTHTITGCTYSVN
ncbi:MAG: FAD-dependent oxidoreductase, partial [Bacteroidales bacterium]|nr:FAD-dependent oxidoreductase [Bacteroidales bacterium]